MCLPANMAGSLVTGPPVSSSIFQDHAVPNLLLLCTSELDTYISLYFFSLLLLSAYISSTFRIGYHGLLKGRRALYLHESLQ